MSKSYSSRVQLFSVKHQRLACEGRGDVGGMIQKLWELRAQTELGNTVPAHVDRAQGRSCINLNFQNLNAKSHSYIGAGDSN